MIWNSRHRISGASELAWSALENPKILVGITIIRVEIRTRILLKTNMSVNHSTEQSKPFGVNINSRHDFAVLNLIEFTKLHITSWPHSSA